MENIKYDRLIYFIGERPCDKPWRGFHVGFAFVSEDVWQPITDWLDPPITLQWVHPEDVERMKEYEMREAQYRGRNLGPAKAREIVVGYLMEAVKVFGVEHEDFAEAMNYCKNVRFRKKFEKVESQKPKVPQKLQQKLVEAYAEWRWNMGEVGLGWEDEKEIGLDILDFEDLQRAGPDSDYDDYVFGNGKDGFTGVEGQG